MSRITGAERMVVVPHTHWDREWYEPFQVFRLRLVEMLDDVLARAEAEPSFRFTLDGQTAAIEDYLAMRPENWDRVRALVERGQLALGPFLILLDEFLCSGETIVRNLELGWHGAAALGRAMPVGHLPDMFGHTAQMPQILARAGIADAAMWRGVPASVDKYAFRWEAPDGSAVRVQYLFDGYGNALDVFALPERLDAAIDSYRSEMESWYDGEPVLGMLGSDHTAPRPDLEDLVRDRDGVVLATLDEYVARFGGVTDGLPVVHGEMRSHARGNILPGVISIRVGLKKAMAQGERMLTSAEAVLAGAGDPDAAEPYQPFLDHAWHQVVESTAHDSVTGCGVDATADQVAARLASAAQIGRAVRDRAVAIMAANVPADAFVVVNTLPTARHATVELTAAVDDDAAPMAAQLGDGTVIPLQEIGGLPELLGDEKLAAGDLDRVVRRIHGRELFGQQIDDYTITPGALTVTVAEVPTTAEFDLAAFKAELAENAVAHGDGEWTVTTLARPRRRFVAAVPTPPSGCTPLRLVRRTAPSSEDPAFAGVTVGERSIRSELVDVTVGDDGTLTVRGPDGTVLTGVGRLVDGGDRGDSYNYGPPAHDLVVDRPVSVHVEVVESGPVRGVLNVTRTYDVPLGLVDGDPDRRAEDTVPMAVTSRVEVRVGEPFVRVEVSFVNPARDHRLRWHVPLPSPVTESHAEGQFAVTTRGLTAEGGWGEYPLPTFPASSFVSAGPATVLLDHVTEYELVDEGRELALTLVRAVGMMSVNVHPLRDEPAGSEFEVPGAQYVGVPVTARLAVSPHAGGWAADAANAPLWADHVRTDAVVARGAAAPGGDLPAGRNGVAVDGAGVVTTALRPREGGVEVRVVALSDTPTTATITGPFTAARRTDLLGRDLGPLSVADGRATVDLGPWEIATVRLEASGRR